MKKTIAVLFILASCSVMADEYTYDWKTGNSYSTSQNIDGSTTVRGSNLSNGSTWTTTIEKDGTQRGRDTDGNYWKYNGDSGSYINYGTGKSCFGTGAAKVCN